MIEEALGMISLVGQKPSLCLMRFQRKLAECNLTLDDDVIKRRLMPAMPISVKMALSAHLELPVEQFAKLADTIYSYSNTIVATPTPNVFAASAQQMPTRSLYNQHSTKSNQRTGRCGRVIGRCGQPMGRSGYYFGGYSTIFGIFCEFWWLFYDILGILRIVVGILFGGVLGLRHSGGGDM